MRAPVVAALLMLTSPAWSADATSDASPAPAAGAGAKEALPPEAAPKQLHVLEPDSYGGERRFEVALETPIQLNTHFTRHAGVGLTLGYRLNDNLALQVRGLDFLLARESGLFSELVLKAHEEPMASDALLLRQAVLAGVELLPAYGKVSLFGGDPVRLALAVDAAGGVGSVGLLLRPGDAVGGRTTGGVGLRPMGQLGVGMRAYLSSRLALKLDLQDLVYSAYVTRVNGCTAADATAIAQDGPQAGVSTSCHAASFSDSEGDVRRSAAAAADQLRSPSAGVINQIFASAGASFVF